MKETAEELGNKHEMTDKQKSAMIEFAKIHVLAALEASSEIPLKDLGGWNTDGTMYLSNKIVDKKSILNCYSLDNIK